MRGKHLVVLLLGTLFVAIAFIFWLGSSGGPGRSFESPAPSGSSRRNAPTTSASVEQAQDGALRGKADIARDEPDQ